MADGLTIVLPDAVLDDIARRTAAIVLDRIREQTPEAWMNTTQAAQHLDVHPSTIRALAASGEIESVQDTPRGRRRFRRSDLDQWRSTAS